MLLNKFYFPQWLIAIYFFIMLFHFIIKLPKCGLFPSFLSSFLLAWDTLSLVHFHVKICIFQIFWKVLRHYIPSSTVSSLPSPIIPNRYTLNCLIVSTNLLPSFSYFPSCVSVLQSKENFPTYILAHWFSSPMSNLLLNQLIAF